MQSRTGLHFQRYPDWWDVWNDGTLIGTVHLIAGGWVFYRTGSRTTGLPDGTGPTQHAAVHSTLRAE
jgi:hypothetical protein